MPGLDLLRLAAALLVMAFHLTHWTWLDHSAQGIPREFRILQPVSSRGWVGVQIFFALSGFVIAYSMEGLTPARFVRRRAERLLPAAVVCASFTAVLRLLVSHGAGLGAQWLRSVVFWPVGPWIDGSYWTLSIEVAFYGLMSGVLLLYGGRFFTQVVFGLGALSASCDLLLLGRPGWLPPRAYLQLGLCWFPPYACFLLVYGTFFALGSFLFLLLVRGGTVARFAGALVSAVGCVAEILWHDRGLIFTNPPRVGGWGSVTIWILAVSLLVVSVLCTSQISSAMTPEALKFIRLAGLTTYPLYLLHAEIGEWLIHGLCHRIGAVPALLAATFLVVALAVSVTVVFEPPLRTLLRRTLR